MATEKKDVETTNLIADFELHVMLLIKTRGVTLKAARAIAYGQGPRGLDHMLGQKELPLEKK